MLEVEKFEAFGTKMNDFFEAGIVVTPLRDPLSKFLPIPSILRAEKKIGGKREAWVELGSH